MRVCAIANSAISKIISSGSICSRVCGSMRRKSAYVVQNCASATMSIIVKSEVHFASHRIDVQQMQSSCDGHLVLLGEKRPGQTILLT